MALKTLRTREPRAILRLKHEFRALRDLQHPNLVRFGELFESGGDWFFTMELVRGVDVSSWVRARDGSQSSGSSPISSRKRVPPWARSNAPALALTAPVKAPRS